MSENGVFKDIMFGTIGYIFGRHQAERRPLRLPAPFKAKIVITVPSWAIPLVAVATGVGVYFKFSVILNVIELLIICASFLFVWEMGRMASRLRYRMHHMLNGIDEDADDRYGPWMDELPKPTTDKKTVTMKKAS